MKVKIMDYTTYEENKSQNGGNYWYSEEFEIVDGKAVNGTYSTSSDFQYCEFCGNFGCHECDTYSPSWMAYGYAEDRLANSRLAMKMDLEIVEFD